MTARPTSRAPRSTSCSTQDVDVIVGAASSGVSLSVIDKITGAGVVAVLAGQHRGRASTPTTTTASTSAPPRPTSSRARCSPTSRSRTASRTSRSWPARTPTARVSPSRSRTTLKEKGASVAEYVLYTADATELHRRGQQGRGGQAGRDRAGRLRGDHQDHPAADRQGLRSAGHPDLLRGRQHWPTTPTRRSTSPASRAPSRRPAEPDPAFNDKLQTIDPKLKDFSLRSAVLRRRRC